MSLNKFAKGLDGIHSAYEPQRLSVSQMQTQVYDAGSKKQDFNIHDTKPSFSTVLLTFTFPTWPLPEGSGLMLCIMRVPITAEHQSWKRIVFRTSLSICSLSAVITSSLKGEYPWERPDKEQSEPANLSNSARRLGDAQDS